MTVQKRHARWIAALAIAGTGVLTSAAAVSATDRESTRKLLGMIASRLEDRWTQAATVPSFTVPPEEPEGGDGTDPGAQELTTLEQMLGYKHKRASARA